MRHRRLRHAWLVICGRIDFEYSTERMELYMALDKTNAALADLQAAVNRIVAKSTADDATIAQLNQEVADADATAAADIAAMTASVNAAAPAPVAQPDPNAAG